MEDLLVINASDQNWKIGRQQDKPVIGFPAKPFRENIGYLMRLGLRPGAIFVGVSCRRLCFFGSVSGVPYIDETPIWPSHSFPLRIQYSVIHQFGGAKQWYRGGDSRDVLECLFLRTLYLLPAENRDHPNVRGWLFEPALKAIREQEEERMRKLESGRPVL